MKKRKIIFGGVCATGIAVAAMLSVVSCSGDDECYEGGNYTLAKKRVTRSELEGGTYVLEQVEQTEFDDGVSRNVSVLYSIPRFGGGNIAVKSVSDCDFYRLSSNYISSTGNLVDIGFEIKAAIIKKDDSRPDSIKYDTIFYSGCVKRKYSLTMFKLNV